jgi:NAD(P)-dependent dehydrogenase (short-subunit alcohol dehydrogenase family)
MASQASTVTRARVVLVTGASSGLGQACCDRLSQAAGTRVFGASRSTVTAESWTHIPMDVTDDASVAAGIAEILRREGRLDAVVHCAGVSLAGSIEDTTAEEAARQFDTNYFGTIRVIRAALPQMRRQGSGKIIVMGSIAGLIGLPFLGHYSASKFALDGLIEALRTEIAPFGIEATVVHPGDFRTAFGANRVLCGGQGEASAYFARCRDTVKFYDAAEQTGGSPDAVARKVERLIGMRRLPVRVIVGAPLEIGGTFAKRVLPARWFEFVFRKAHSP